MNEEIKKYELEIAKAFNAKPKNGITKIVEICQQQGIEPEEQIAKFFYAQKNNLDLEAVGDYLSGPEEQNKKVLGHFTQEIDLSGQSFTEGLRGFLKTFKLPGEAQKIDRLVESFSETYCNKNPDGQIANKDSAYTLAFATIMLATDLHNPSIKPEKKMTLEQFKGNTRGVNNGGDFNPSILEGIYAEIKKEKFELNFAKISQGYELSPTALETDKTFRKLNSLLRSTKTDNTEVKKVFPKIDDNVTAEVTKPKSWLNKLTGYEGTITLTDSKTNAKVNVQIYKPTVFSKYLFGEQPKTIIQPFELKGATPEQKAASLDLAAKVAASFSSPLSSIKATFDYEKTDLKQSYEEAKSQQREINLTKEDRAIAKGIAESIERHKASSFTKDKEKSEDYAITPLSPLLKKQDKQSRDSNKR